MIPWCRKNYVYIARGANSGIIKVGLTVNVARRLSQISYERKEEFRLLVAVRGNPRDEINTHAFCGNPLFGREWFQHSRRIAVLIGFMRKHRRPSKERWRLK